jgi:predicted kinase
MTLADPAVIVVCGWPLSGKSEVASRVGRALGLHVADDDEIAAACVGLPDPDWRSSDERRRRNLNRTAMAYELLHQTVRVHLEIAEPPRSIVVASTYSRPSSWRFLQKALAPHPRARLAVVWLRPVDDTPDRVHELLERRAAAGYRGGCTTAAEYFDVKARFVPPPMPHLMLDTWLRSTPEECARRSLDYILDR